jgi:hypothetical protein
MAIAMVAAPSPVLTAALKAPAPHAVKAVAMDAVMDAMAAVAVVAVAVNAKAARSANASALTESRWQPTQLTCKAPWQTRVGALSLVLIGLPARNDQSAQSAQIVATVLAGAVSAKMVNALTPWPSKVRTTLAHRNP